MPFWYGSLQSFWLYYRVDPEVLRQRLPQLPGGEALHVAMFDFDGEHAGLASVDLQIYTGHGPAYLEAVHEVEFNFYVYPQARVPEVPAMSWRDYVTGQDQTKTIGGFRLHVPSRARSRRASRSSASRSSSRTSTTRSPASTPRASTRGATRSCRTRAASPAR
jgi:hypothetical protein